LPDSSDLEKLFIATLESGKDDAKKLRNLFDAISSVTPSVKVVVHGTCINAGKVTAAAAAATYWGPDGRLNTSTRLSGQQTSPRTELLAVILVLQRAPTFKSLEIHMRSQYAIRSAVYYAANNDACGWRNTNGDLSKVIVSLIKGRTISRRKMLPQTRTWRHCTRLVTSLYVDQQDLVVACKNN
ncbi:hypothetical protein DFH08DRAFT_720115, partial [Mycena albidolilacea]